MVLQILGVVALVKQTIDVSEALVIEKVCLVLLHYKWVTPLRVLLSAANCFSCSGVNRTVGYSSAGCPVGPSFILSKLL